MLQVITELERLRRRSRRMLILQRAAVVLAWGVGVAIVLVGLDWLLRLPASFRAVLLVGGLAALAAAIWRVVVPAFGFRPDLTQIALRVERSLPALAGRLASSVEFATTGADQTNPLAGRTVREAQARLSGESVGGILRPGRTVRDVGIGALLLAAVAALAVVSPATARTGLSRLLLPFGAAQWPARTAVVSLMSEVLVHDGVHPRGEALALRARNRTPGGAGERVDANYRLRRDGRFGDWQRVVLTPQAGDVHERLVDTTAETIEVWFATEDARTEPESIRLVPPPAVTRAMLVVTPPPYAVGRRAALDVDLGPGIDERAVAPEACLAGSDARLTLLLNKPLPLGDDDRDGWLRATLGLPTGPLPGFRVDPDDGRRWRLDWRLDQPVTLDLDLVDEYGLGNRDPIRYRIDVTPDRPPVATITTPERDEVVLANAVVDVTGEASDDVAVSRLRLDARVQRGGSESEEPLAVDADLVVDAAEVTIEAALDLASYDLAEGDVVLVAAVAEDVYEIDGARHEPVESAVRRLRVISELDFSAQLRRQLTAVRQNAIRVEAIQGELQDDVIENGVQPGARRAQAQLGERLAEQREAIGELQDQIRRNRLDDEQLEGLLQQSRDLLDYAGRAASGAVAEIEQRDAARAEADAAGADDRDKPRPDERDETGDPADRAVLDAQQDVRDELSDLIELLDRDEDTWIVQRRLEGLMGQQAELMEQTDRLAQETMGQSLDELDQDQRTELERLADAQMGLRDEARGLIEEMRRRARALEEVDPQSASGMRTAADTAERREVDRDMEQAAQRAEQNQLQSASAAQQAAASTLERMLEDMQETKRAKAEELMRQLASLIESIDRLIVAQENELMALAAAVARADFGGRDRAMIRLNQNTESVAGEARAAGQSARRIARSLDRAADAQGAAILALRADPVGADAATEAEERALALLKEAREQAQELEQETQEDELRQRREELIGAYRALAEKQVAVRTTTQDLGAAGALDRRGLVEARLLGNAQQEIREGVSGLELVAEELVDSPVFSYVHRLIDQWSDAASTALWEGTIDIDVTDRQQMIAEAIARQIEALEELNAPPDEFAGESNAGGGGGGGAGAGPQPLIPPVAELRRVHGLQDQVYGQTRSIDGRTDLTDAQRRQRIRELGGMQRELVRLGEGILESMEQGGVGPVEAPGTEGPDTGPTPGPAPETNEQGAER